MPVQHKHRLGPMVIDADQCALKLLLQSQSKGSLIHTIYMLVLFWSPSSQF